VNVFAVYKAINGSNHGVNIMTVAICLLFIAFFTGEYLQSIKKKLIKSSLEIFLKQNKMENTEILKMTENATLLRHNEELFTVLTDLRLSYISFTIIPAEYNWDVFYLKKGEEQLYINNIKFKPYWEKDNPNFYVKQAKPLNESNSK